MIFSFGEVLEWLSRDFTLVPGDVISGDLGRPPAADRPRFGPTWEPPARRYLSEGDSVEISSPASGALREPASVRR